MRGSTLGVTSGSAHRRLEIIDLTTGDQPMCDEGGNWITYNGEIYNYLELRKEIGEREFRTTSDTEVVLRAASEAGPSLRRALSRHVCVRDLGRDGRPPLLRSRPCRHRKPFCYTFVDGTLFCASEAKALLPFLPSIETDLEALKDYLAFQFCLGGKTLFRGVQEVPPGHTLTIQNGVKRLDRYWEVHFRTGLRAPEQWFTGSLRGTS